MPRYNYVCENCGKDWESIYRIKDMDIPLKNPCPKCETTGKIRRKIMASQITTDPYPKKNNMEFRETMDRIKSHHPHNNIPDY